MIKITLLAVGKLKEKYLIDAVKEYAKRIGRFADFEIIEIAENKTLELEGADILKKVKGSLFIFDLDGEMVSSEEFADVFNYFSIRGESSFTFVIGSSNGLSSEIKKQAIKKFCFGRVTYPHQLMRVIAVEQIYRAMTINNNITYHK